jgi:hypothetical protein
MNTDIYDRANELRDALQEIYNWANAYPLDVFPEPDFKKVREMIGDKLLTEISASNMRHVLRGVKQVCE